MINFTKQKLSTAWNWLKYRGKKFWAFVVGLMVASAWASTLVPGGMVCDPMIAEDWGIMPTEQSGQSAYVYFGRYEEVPETEFDTAHFGIPASDSVSKANAYDMRTKAEREQGLNGYAIFAYAGPVTHENLIGYLGNWEDEMTAEQLVCVASGLNLTGFNGNKPKDIIFESWTRLSGMGENDIPTMIPDRNGKLAISGVGLREKRDIDLADGSEVSTKVLARVREDYRKIRDRALLRERDDPERTQHLRYLDAKSKKWGVDYTQLIPDDLKDEGILPHRTVFSDTFTYSDGDLETVSSDAWTFKDNSFSVVSGQLAADFDSSNVAFWSTDTDDDDVYAIIELIAFSFNKRSGVALRINQSLANDDNYYFVTLNQDSAADTVEIKKNINNTVTPIASGNCSCGDAVSGDTNYGEISGSNFRVEIDGVEELTGSDADLTGFNSVGIYMGDNSPQQLTDNWEGGDLTSELTGDTTIAFDAASEYTGTDTGQTSLTWSHTTAGSDRILIVSAQFYTSDGDDVSGVTYDGVAMTEIRTDAVASVQHNSLWYLLAPATGANDIVVTFTGSTNFVGGGAVSLTGVNQSSPIDTSGSAEDASVELTTTAENTWIFGVETNQGSDGIGVGEDSVERVYDSNAVFEYSIQTKGALAAGSNSINMFPANLGTDIASAVAIKPVVAGAPADEDNTQIIISHESHIPH